MHIMTVKAKKITANVLTAILFLAFVAAGFMKLMRTEEAIDNFKQYGLNVGVLLLIGFLEVLGALGLWLPKLRIWAAAGLSAIMTGAIVVHLYHDEASLITAPVVFFILLMISITLRMQLNSLPKKKHKK
tara:strand:+ start:821 stop:1210 length:390 start_codon:yes stop_codon:yes gene_type:complete